MQGRTYSIRSRIVLITFIPLIVLFFVVLAFYQIYYNATLRQAETAFTSLAEQNEEQIEIRLDSLRLTARSAAYSHAVQNFLFASTPSEQVYDLAATKAHIDAIVEGTDGVSLLLVETEGDQFVYWGSGYTSLKRELEAVTEWQTDANGQSLVIFPDDQQCLLRFQTRPALSASLYGSTMYTYILYDMNRLLPTGSDGEGVLQTLMWQGQPMACSSALTEEEQAQLREISGTNTIVAFRGEQYYVFSKPVLTNNQLHFVMLQPVSALTGTLTVFWHICIAALGAIALMLILLMLLLLKSISYPISLIVRDMSSIHSSTRSVSLTHVEELNTIAHSANRMLMQLGEAQEREIAAQKQYYQAKLEKSRAENIAYRSQINPHFLFNTLECMAGMAEYFHVKPLGELITSLSACFRYSLRAPDAVPFSRELEHLRSYTDVMSIRFPGKFHVRQRIDSASLDAAVPSLLLQPLAENAVLHGFRNVPSGRPWVIHIATQIDQQQEQLHVIFTDNGAGIAPEQLEALQTQIKADATISREHIGLKNIWKRLTLHYGDACDFRITSRQGYYTRMEIILPLTSSEEEG